MLGVAARDDHRSQCVGSTAVGSLEAHGCFRCA
jgi:hypothetical protein